MNTLNIDNQGYDRMRPARMADAQYESLATSTVPKPFKRDFDEGWEDDRMNRLTKTKFTMGKTFAEKFE